jgi:hypothetical protein
MLTEPTIEKLHALHLGAMAAAWVAQHEDPKSHEIDFDSRFGMLVDAEHLSRDNKRIARALREAKLRIPNACVEDIDYSAKRELDRTLVRQLGTCAWIGLHANVIITGATGTGKSYIPFRLDGRSQLAGATALELGQLLWRARELHPAGRQPLRIGRTNDLCVDPRQLRDLGQRPALLKEPEEQRLALARGRGEGAQVAALDRGDRPVAQG